MGIPFVTEDSMKSYVKSKYQINAYQSLDRLSDYLYEIDYDYIDYNKALSFMKDQDDLKPIKFGCSSVRNGNWYGRDYDWNYNKDVDFVIRVPRIGNRYASLGVASTLVFGDKLNSIVVANRNYNELYEYLPFVTLDGINEWGLVCSINVVPAQKGNKGASIPTEEMRIQIPADMIPRYVLDNYKTAEEAVDDLIKHVSIYTMKHLKEHNYEIHAMIADKNKTYVVEVINNKLEAIEHDKMTNFHVIGTEFNDDGSVYTPGTQDDEHSAMRTNKITSHGSGLERYNLIVENYNSLTNKQAMIDLMHETINYKNAYKDQGTDKTWYSEFTGTYPQGDVTVDTKPEIFDEKIMPIVIDQFEHRTREKADTWHTTHTSIYDMENKKLTVFDSTEEDIPHEFNFKHYYTAQEVDEIIAKIINNR